jgi:hypothetical protein
LGNFSLDYCTEFQIAATLESMGHSVIRLQEDIYNNTDVLYQETLANPDVFLYTRTPGFYKDNAFLLLEELTRRNIPTVSLHLDLYNGLKRGELLSSDPFWATAFCFSADGGSEEFFKSWGVNHFWLKPGVYDKECYIAAADRDRFPHDIIFVGNDGSGYHPEWEYRRTLTNWLKNTYGERFAVYPGTGNSAIRSHDLNVLYASAKIAVGDSLCLGFTHEKYVSDRLPEGNSRGAFQIFPRIKGITDEFEDGKNIVLYTFGDFDDLKSKIDYYLLHDEERESIRKASQLYTSENWNYQIRMTEMFKVLSEQLPQIRLKLRN